MASGYFALFPSTLYFKPTSGTSDLRVTHASKSIPGTFSCSYFLTFPLVFKPIPALCGVLEVLYAICPLKPLAWLPPKPYEERRTTQPGHELFRGWDSVTCFLVQTVLCVSAAEPWLIAGPRVRRKVPGCVLHGTCHTHLRSPALVTVQTSTSLSAAFALGRLTANGLRLETIRFTFLSVLSPWETTPEMLLHLSCLQALF